MHQKSFVGKPIQYSLSTIAFESLFMYHSKDVCQYWPKSAHLVWADLLGFHDPSLGFTPLVFACIFMGVYKKGKSEMSSSKNI